MREKRGRYHQSVCGVWIPTYKAKERKNTEKSERKERIQERVRERKVILVSK